jgi:hypothetical protein
MIGLLGEPYLTDAAKKALALSLPSKDTAMLLKQLPKPLTDRLLSEKMQGQLGVAGCTLRPAA